MNIKILGRGCAKCHRLEQVSREAAAELGIEARFEHVTDTDGIMAYSVVTTPALVVNESVKVSGRVPSRDEVKAWLRAA